MRFELRDYQRKAAKDVLTNLARGIDSHQRYGTNSAFSLSALTGAGKTVMATAVIEAMLHGSADLDTEPNRTVTFLWVTDDPSLNRQTIDRMIQASDVLTVGQLIEIDETFDQRTFEPGNVYFLNTQKLGKSTGYVRSGTDLRTHSIWDTVRNTIEADGVDLVLVLDEAHKGMRPQRDKKTLVRQLIDGPPAIPVVWGISATVERFEEAMEKTTGRDKLTNVRVDNELIRASGLVKDQVVLANPDEKGVFHSTLLRDATREVVEMERRWTAYTEANNLPPVLPILVAQLEDKAEENPGKLAETLQTIYSQWPGLRDDAVVHVFGEHANLDIAGRKVRYVSPERIQDDDTIRVVLAKEAISTGWDCPRAEVLYSERGGRDDTRIAQLIGRIVRTPLAQRILGDEKLGQVSCFLPQFDRDAVNRVINRLRTGDDSVVADPVRKTADFPRVPEQEQAGVFERLSTVPCLPTPQPLADPVRRAKKLASHLSGDGILEGAHKHLTQRLNQRLDGLMAEHAKAVEENIADIMRVDLEMTRIELYDGTAKSDPAGIGEVTREKTYSRTDARNVDDAFKVASRAIKEGVVNDYLKHRISIAEEAGDEVDIVDVKAEVAAVVGVPGVVDKVREAADEWVVAQLAEYRVEIRSLTDDKRNHYLAVQAQSTKVERVDLLVPDVVNATTETITADGESKVVELHEGHIYADAAGKFPAKLNDWEKEVVKAETKRDSFVGWYRNPSSARDTALRIAYWSEGKWASLQPDFIIISRKADGELAVSIVDPHGDHLADALPKLKALADYAERFGPGGTGEVLRVESVAKVDGELRVLDLTEPTVRDAVRAFEEAQVKPLYAGELAATYR